MPPSPRYRPDPRHPSLGDEVFDVVTAARFPTLTLRYRNQRWAARVGLDTLTDDEWQAHFGRFEPLPDNLAAPLALRYHGHQFRTYNPALGDGRGFLFAQLRDDDDRLLDLATKGSGQTPWSRGGDGRLTLKGGVREVLATELLEALGVPTSKTFSLFETGEALRRNDEPSPTRASVLVRLGHSHVRFGSFQRLAYLGDRRTLRALVGYALAHYAPELCHLDDGDAAPALLRLVIARSARLCAAWMAAGFVHGVLNTDNLNVTGESFDYGPYRLLPVLDPGFTAAYFDHGGLYAYGAQPEAVRWALEQLAGALEVLAPDRDLGRLVAGFEPAYQRALDAAVIARLGLASRGALPDRLLRTGVLQLVH
ncbi:MAG: YdiU family protein, partial [Myxococcales bacterium]|nr:YdiU family protein [Myxococcales bacterium]